MSMSNHRFKVSITADGDTREDVIIALREIAKMVDDGYLSGADVCDTGEYQFIVTEAPPTGDIC